MAFAFIALGIVRFFGGAGIGGLWIAFIGWFLLQAARAKLSSGRIGTRAQGRERCGRDDAAIAPRWMASLNVQNFVDHELLRTGRRCFIVVDKGEVTGMVTPHEIKQIDRAKWPSLTMHDIMRPLGDLHAVTPEAPLTSALESMSRYDLNQLPVISDGHLEGVLSRAQVLSYLQTHAELRG